MQTLKRIGIVVLVLALLAAIADRALWWLSEDLGRDALVERGFTSPTLDVGGVPFLTQVARGRLEDVRVSAPSVATQGSQVRDFHLHAEGVVLDLAHRSVKRAERLRLSLRLPPEQITGEIERQLDSAGATVELHDHHLRLHLPLAGAEGVTSDITLAPGPQTASDHPSLTAQFTNITFSHPLARQLFGTGLSLPPLDVPLDQLPRHLAVTAIDVGPDGVTVRLNGHDVPLAR